MSRWHRGERVLWRRSFERIVLLAPGRDDMDREVTPFLAELLAARALVMR